MWFEKLGATLIYFGFKQTVADYSLFTLIQNGYFIIALVYVDDILLNGNCSALISQIKAFLDQSFTIKDLGLEKYYLGLEVTYLEYGIFLHQHKFIYDLLVDAGLEDSKPLSLPVDTSIKLSLEEGLLLDDPSIYRKYVGKLLYLTLSRPDIAYIVHHLSQFLQTPRVPHMLAVQRVLRYLKGTPFQGLFFPASSNLQLHAFCDSDWVTVEIQAKVLVDIVCFWEHLWLIGIQRNKKLFLNLLQNLNCVH